mmetsp:Transcript_6840/g.15121  ORF Transcript_6840/g.15121 Transcript_6840/m.15121 type:complete len:144 (+) Transcript_6840:90-521(+)
MGSMESMGPMKAGKKAWRQRHHPVCMDGSATWLSLPLASSSFNTISSNIIWHYSYHEKTTFESSHTNCHQNIHNDNFHHPLHSTVSATLHISLLIVQYNIVNEGALVLIFLSLWCNEKEPPYSITVRQSPIVYFGFAQRDRRD